MGLQAGIEHLSDKLEGLKLDVPNIALTEDTVVDVLAQGEQKLVKARSSMQT